MVTAASGHHAEPSERELARGHGRKASARCWSKALLLGPWAVTGVWGAAEEGAGVLGCSGGPTGHRALRPEGGAVLRHLALQGTPRKSGLLFLTRFVFHLLGR